MIKEIKKRLIRRSEKDKNGCWNYLGSISKMGYGKTYGLGRHQLAHRLSYIVFKGKIPNGLFLDHLCRNRKCINPKHLEIVTNRENILRGEGIPAKNYRKIKCIHGHRFTPENTYMKSNGSRQCVICKKAHQKNYWKTYKRPLAIEEVKKAGYKIFKEI